MYPTEYNLDTPLPRPFKLKQCTQDRKGVGDKDRIGVEEKRRIGMEGNFLKF